MTTFQNSVKIGDKVNSTGKLQYLGFVPVVQSALLSYTDAGTAKSICVIPANSQILEIYVDVLTAFNSSGTDLLDIGVSGTANLFADNLDLSAQARLLGTSDVSQITNYQDTGSSQITLKATYAQSVADASTGSARITVVYIPGNNLL